ncbi:hypothetical protein BSKO_03452 [Bryopsis sp. KO-2023]|nr:hypothetical protein BSKO_03452 [Bryopsis sp. KO-2023]
MKKKVDPRIRTLVENCVKLRQRGMFVIVGDKGREQVVNLHYMLSKTLVTARPSVLWCYKKELFISSHKSKRHKQIQRMVKSGLMDPDKEDPFTMFVACTNIRYCYYNETHKILGNTYGMCVLQDFEAMTPNLLARTIETVEGGGLVVLLLSTLTSLTQLYTLTMDVHSRLRTESHKEVVGRFNERLVLSLASGKNCILMDDELNVLPSSTLVKYIVPVEVDEEGNPVDDPSKKNETELLELKESLVDTQPAGSLVGKCKTLDQARAVMTFMDAASEKTLRSTVALTAARGRGKSSAMGLAISGAIALGYSNIFVTAPSPENLRTLFEFVFKGLDALGYKEHMDYDLVESSNPDFGKAIVRVNIFRHHRQTVQYILPQHHNKLSQAELVIIDEAAAIPLPMVKAMMGNHLVFMGSTVNGYEGTGRSLSLKLIQQLRDQGSKEGKKGKEGEPSGRSLREVTLSEPIRYGPGDPVEKWLHDLLCLDCSENLPRCPARLPHPEECDLYFVERDTLLSFHKASEAFLQRMMSLYVASHYKNTPNDLILMSDAPAHRLFVLLGPVDETQNALPDILCVVQVALEGAISRRSVMKSLSLGSMPSGDLIPWTVGQQFQDQDFPQLSGARIVRIAVHPEMTRAGYGARAVDLLQKYYEGQMLDVDGNFASEEDEPNSTNGGAAAPPDADGQLLSEQIKPRADLPPLLVNLSDRKPERLHYLGTSYGLTQQLFSFWRKCGFRPVYLRQTASEVTGEYSMLMMKPLRSQDMSNSEWLGPFVEDFKKRFISLLNGAFRDMDLALALSIVDAKLSYPEVESQKGIKEGVTVSSVNGQPLSAYDLKRLQSYANNVVDHHVILDLVPALGRSYFSGNVPASLSHTQAAILLCMGLQQRSVSDVEKILKLPSNQVLALFSKMIRKLHSYLSSVKEESISRNLPKPERMDVRQAAGGDDDAPEEDDQGGKEFQAELAADRVNRFAMKGVEDDGSIPVPVSGQLVSLRRKEGDDAQKNAKKRKNQGKFDKKKRKKQ